MASKTKTTKAAPSKELLSALELVRKEKDARAAAFKTDIDELCKKHKVSVAKMEISVQDIDAEMVSGE